jgi:VWFA-related protein
MRTARLFPLLIGWGLMIGASASAAAQQTSAAQQTQPTFRTTVDVVAVDVSVIDREGRPVDDLKAANFTLKVDGKPRQLRSAEYVSLERPEPAGGETPTYSSNANQQPGRLILIVIDQGNIHKGTGKEAFKAAARFVDSLNPSDRVALELIPGAGPLVDFTSNHAFVRTMLDRVSGQAIEAQQTGRVGVSEAMAVVGRSDQFAWQSIIERECAGVTDAGAIQACQQLMQGEARAVYTQTRFNTTTSLLSLRQIIDRLRLTSEPKTVVLISEGLVLENDFVDLSWVGPRTAQARVSLYGIRLSTLQYDAEMGRTSPTREADRDLLAAGMELLVSLGRGAIYQVGVNADAPFVRLAKELSAYYLLSFEPTVDDRDGKTHQISVTVDRRNMLVRARRQFAAPSSSAYKSTDDLLVELLRSGLLATDFDLSLTTYAYRDDITGRIKLMVSAAIDRATNPAGPFAVAYYVSDEHGNMAAADVDKSVVPAPGREGKTQYYMGAVAVDPGIYNIKLAVVDEQGRRASVQRSFEAKLTPAGPATLGELMLARPGSGASPILPAVDGRIDTDTLVGYLEVYADAEATLAQATVQIELATAPDSKALTGTAMSLAAAKNGKRAGQVAIPVAQLAPGDYIARAVLSIAGRPVATVSRPFAITHTTSTPLPPPPGPPVAFNSRIESFDRQSVLTRPVVGFFLDRMNIVGLPALPEALTPAIGFARMGRFTDAGKIVQTAGVDHFAGTFLDGLSLLAQGDVSTAAQRFGDTLRRAPTFFPATFYLGACYAAAGQDEEATRAWGLALVTDPAAPWIYTLLADALLRLKRAPEAADVLQIATRTWPESDDVIMRLGTAWSMTGRSDQALRVLDPYLSRHPTDGDRLMLAMRLIYEARSSDHPIESVEADRARFLRYFDAYRAMNGPDLSLAEKWRLLVDR